MVAVVIGIIIGIYLFPPNDYHGPCARDQESLVYKENGRKYLFRAVAVGG